MRLSLRISFFVFHPDELRPCYQGLGLLCSFIFRNLYFVVVFYGLLLISLLFFFFFSLFLSLLSPTHSDGVHGVDAVLSDKRLGQKKAKWGCGGLGPREQSRRFSITTQTILIQNSYY